MDIAGVDTNENNLAFDTTNQNLDNEDEGDLKTVGKLNRK